MAARTGAGGDANGGGAAFARTLLSSLFFSSFFFVFSSFRGGVTPAASRSSVKLNFRNASKRRRSGAACTSSAEPEIRRAVVSQDGAVERHLAADRNIGIAVQHLVAEQVERDIAAPARWYTPC